MLFFKNDYNSLGSSEIMSKLASLALENNIGYGEDIHSKNAKELIRKEINCKNADIYFLSGGTITNRIGLYACLKPYEAVIGASSAHINVHETGAVESSGHKVLTVASYDGKLKIEDIDSLLKVHDSYHMVKPKCVYISQSTELGTTYTKDEISTLYNYCKEHDLYLFIDGARLGVALIDTNMSLEFIAANSDIFYIGGTKNGAPLGEALVITNDKIKTEFAYLLKNQGGLLAKGFMCGIIFEEFFTNDLYYKNARNSYETANKLREVFERHNFEEVYKNKTNQIFIKLSYEQNKILKEYVMYEEFEKYDDYVILRFVTNFNTSIFEIEEFDRILSKIF